MSGWHSWALWVPVAAVGLALLDRLFLALEARGVIYYRKRKAQVSSQGSVLLQLSAVFEPAKRYVIEARRPEAKTEREDGATPGDGGEQAPRFVIPGK